MEVKDVMKKASDIWKNMSQNEKSKYNPTPQLIESNRKVFEDYQSKFIKPIKNSKINLHNYHVLKMKDQLKNKSIEEIAKTIKESYDKLSES